MGKRGNIEKTLENSRKNLLLVIVFSLINVLLSLFNSTVTFLFSASFPWYVLEFGKTLAQEFDSSLLVTIAAIISFVAISLYGICYLLAKKHRIFILFALILFSLDTLFLLWTITLGFDASVLIDIAFHAWVMYYLIADTKAWLDLKKAPSDDEEIAEENDQAESGSNTEALRPESMKGRVILAQIVGSLDIKVKRLFGVTELIVNGMVYAEKKGIIESAYTLEARVENVPIQATMDAAANMCLYVDGSLLEKKKRLI